MSLTPTFLDELRARTLLSALIGKSLKLTKAGREYKGCCPFHNEKTPSFYVNDDKGFYHCFGCSAHGDAIRWLTDQQGLPFIDAVKELAGAAGMEMPAPDPRAAERAVRDNTLYDVMSAAADWFADQLHAEGGAPARDYLHKRGITLPLAKAFGLGLAPDNRGALKAALARFGEGKLIEAGLLILVEGKESYDRFRGRLMIPIKDARGRVIAFGGRILGAGEPKYLNSPDTPLFDKGRTLYNLDRAGPASRKSGRVIVVEGYMDVIALAKAGIDEVVAPLGTALTEQQLQRLWRLTDAPILCFDGDAAGQKAAARAAHRALPMAAPGQTLQFATLPEGQDPDDVLREAGTAGKAAIEKLFEQPKPLVQQLWASELHATDMRTPEARAGLKQRLDDLASSIDNRYTRDEYRAAFRSMFWEEFGWKRKEIEFVRSALLAQRGEGPNDARYWLFAAILWGLSRYPSVLKNDHERIFRLEMTAQPHKDWRLLLFEALNDRDHLDSDLIDTAMGADFVAPLEKRDLRRDVAFSFVFRRPRQANDERARRDLEEVIDITLSARDIELRMEAARAKWSSEDHGSARGDIDQLIAEKSTNAARLRKLIDPEEWESFRKHG